MSGLFAHKKINISSQHKFT